MTWRIEAPLNAEIPFVMSELQLLDDDFINQWFEHERNIQVFSGTGPMPAALYVQSVDCEDCLGEDCLGRHGAALVAVADCLRCAGEGWYYVWHPLNRRRIAEILRELIEVAAETV